MRKKKEILLFVCFVYCSIYSIAQTDTTAFSLPTKDRLSVHERDFSDVLHSFSKKEKHKDTAANAAAKYYHTSLIPAVGYTLQTGFAGILSANLAFANDNKPDTKLSSITTSLTYSQYSQTIVPVLADIWTKNNTYNFVSDNRFIAYPSDIYGLGGRTDPNKGLTINFTGLKLHETILRSVRKNLYAGVGFYFDKFWGIKALDSLKRRDNTRFTRELGSSETAVGVALKLLFDSRLNQINATNGWYANVVYRPNFKFLGSDTRWQSLLVDVRKYVTFPKNSRNTLAFWNLYWLTTAGTPPYLLLPSTGWDDQYNTGRGYIQGRFRGDNMYYFETEYRYCITRNGLLGGVVFANVQKFSGEISKQFSSFTPSYGLGLRIKLNKYSGANLCIDYGFGKDGSKGFFVNLGEVF
ncbi:hypothetical protein [Parasediminibacterium sp. JCM 36343]|uniref:hypothetical protein n=1 Tax=Parasediminibacterium sp. JCM 36343 TaxID=3374279 RepID=UPI0039785228